LPAQQQHGTPEYSNKYALEQRPESFIVLLLFDRIMEKFSSIAFEAAKSPASSTFCLSAHNNFISLEL